MVRKGLCVLGLAAGALLLGAISPLAAQKGPAAPAGSASRYRVAVVRVANSGGYDMAPLKIGDVVGEDVAAIVPKAAAAAATGYFGAVAYPSGLLTKLSSRGHAEVIFRGEVEAAGGEKVSLHSGRRFPVTGVDVRGESTIVVTKFQQVGEQIEIERCGEGDDHQLSLEGSAVSAAGPGFTPVISTFHSQGTVRLPDGMTAVFRFLDRVDGGEVAHAASEWRYGRPPATEKAPVPDVVVEYWVLITRLDLADR